jgi:hypothetical protein
MVTEEKQFLSVESHSKWQNRSGKHEHWHHVNKLNLGATVKLFCLAYCHEGVERKG